MSLIKVLKYGFYDLMRSRWAFIYLGFYLLLTSGLFLMSPDPTKVIISLLNIVLIMAPLMAILISTMYYYNSRDFLEYLLSQPIPRSSVILGIYGALCLSLMSSLILGVGIPAIIFGIFKTNHWDTYLSLVLMGSVLSCIFSGIALLISLKNENRIKGFGLAILVWLFLALIYDGFILLALLYFKDYPLEKFALSSMVLNPIDLARTFILLKLDISALMGYTGAVIQKFYSGLLGWLLIAFSLFLWVLLPILGIRSIGNRKDW